MSDITGRLRQLYVQNGTNYVQEAADEIERLRSEVEALLADAERYRYLRNRNSAQVLETAGPAAGCWIDCDDEDGGLCLLTGQDADAAIDAQIDEEINTSEDEWMRAIK